MHYTAVYEYTVLNQVDTDLPAPAHKGECKEYHYDGPYGICPDGSDILYYVVVLIIPERIETLRIYLMLYDSTVFNDLLAALIHLVIHGLFFGRSDPESEVLCDESPDRRKLYSVLVDEMLLLFNVAVGLPEEALFSVFKEICIV